jgi:hypothetical protein
MAIDDLEDRLREALTPPPDQIDRIVRRALAEPDRRSPLRRLVPAASLLALLIAAAAFFFVQIPRPQPSAAVVSIVNLGGVVIASSPEEARPLILSGTGETDPPGIILIRHGDLQ